MTYLIQPIDDKLFQTWSFSYAGPIETAKYVGIYTEDHQTSLYMLNKTAGFTTEQALSAWNNS